MPEKPIGQIIKELKEIEHFKWKFLRRNKNYQHDYDIYKKKEGEFYIDNPGASDEDYNNWIKEQDEHFYEKWYVDYPCDYRKDKPKPFPEITIDEAPVIVCNKTMKCRMGDMLLLDHDKEIRMPQNMGLCINLNHPKEKIMASLENILNGAIKERKENNIRHSYRTRLIEYPEYLKVWDFIQLHPKRAQKWLAKRLYPKQYPEHEEETVHFMVERYKACKKLIEGGYVTIR